MALLSRDGLRRGEARIAIVTLAIVLAAMSMPSLCGIVMVDAGGAFTMDICHPLQPAGLSIASRFAPPAPMALVFRVASIPRATKPLPIVLADRLADAPDPQPPEKSL